MANEMVPRTLLDHLKYQCKVSSIIQLNVKIEFTSHFFKKTNLFCVLMVLFLCRNKEMMMMQFTEMINGKDGV